MVVMGIDLASRRYTDIGVTLIQRTSAVIDVAFLRPAEYALKGVPQVEPLAHWVAGVAAEHRVSVIALDGPQAWKAAENGLEHARVCERQLRTQAKTGLPGAAKPGTALRFVRFAIDFFAALERLGWPRLIRSEDASRSARVAIEVFPTAAWRALGLPPLPAKRAKQRADVAVWLPQLEQCFPLRLAGQPSHDELQALIAGLVALAMAEGDWSQIALFGEPLALVDGAWREGYIVNWQTVKES
jgi:hypothetical protein